MSTSIAVSEAAPENGTAPKPIRHCKAAGGARLGEGNGRETQRLAAVILEVLAGARTPQQAATTLNLSVPRYYQLETRALQGLVQACAAKPRGPVPNSERELRALRRQQERLQRELTRQQSLLRLAQRTIGLSPPKAEPAPAGGGKGKKRRRRPVVRALAAALQLQQRSLEAQGQTNGDVKSPE